MARYTKEQRVALLEQRNEGESIKSFSKRIGISDASIYKWQKELCKDKGSFEPIRVMPARTSCSEVFIQIHTKGIEILVKEYVKPEYIRALLGW